VVASTVEKIITTTVEKTTTLTITETKVEEHTATVTHTVMGVEVVREVSVIGFSRSDNARGLFKRKEKACIGGAAKGKY
jgi:hypothetical protein